MGLFSNSGDAVIIARLSRLERRLDAILAHLGAQVPGDDMEDIRGLIASGQKIAAIKVYRERTGPGLAEAKETIDRMLP